jgi:hypothetical protein
MVRAQMMRAQWFSTLDRAIQYSGATAINRAAAAYRIYSSDDNGCASAECTLCCATRCGCFPLMLHAS